MSLRAALRRVLKRPRLVLGMWLLGLGLSLLAGLPVLLGLSSLLAERPLGAALAAGRADAVFGELLGDNPALGAALTASLLGAALPGWLLSAALAGALLDALRRPGDPRRVSGRAVLRRAGETAPAMLRLFSAGLLLRGALLIALLVIGAGLRRALEGRGLLPLVALGGGALLLGALLWSALGVALHFARLWRLASLDGPGASRTFSALRQGLRRARRAWPATLGLAVLSTAVMLLTTVGARAVTLGLNRAGAALLLVLGWQQLAALVRTAAQLTIYAGAVDAFGAVEGRGQAGSVGADDSGGAR